MTRWNMGATALVMIVALAGCQQDRGDAVTTASEPRLDDRTDPPADTRPTPAEAERRPMIAMSSTDRSSR